MTHLAGRFLRVLVCVFFAGAGCFEVFGVESSANSAYRVHGWTLSASGGRIANGSHRLSCVAGESTPEGGCGGGLHDLWSGYSVPGIVRRLMQFALAPGWNLKGSPGATDLTIEEIFRGASGAPIKVGDIRYWDAALQEYADGDDADPLVGGWGFWVFSYWGGEGRAFESADAREVRWTEELLDGWNLYTPPFHVTVPSGMDILVVWRWDADAGAYELVYPGQNLFPG